MTKVIIDGQPVKRQDDNEPKPDPWGAVWFFLILGAVGLGWLYQLSQG